MIEESKENYAKSADVLTRGDEKITEARNIVESLPLTQIAGAIGSLLGFGKEAIEKLKEGHKHTLEARGHVDESLALLPGRSEEFTDNYLAHGLQGTSHNTSIIAEGFPKVINAYNVLLERAEELQQIAELLKEAPEGLTEALDGISKDYRLGVTTINSVASRL